MFASKAGAYPSEAPFTLGWAPVHIHKYYARPERPAGDKHFRYEHS